VVSRPTKKTTIAGANGGVIGGCRGSRGLHPLFEKIAGTRLEIKAVLFSGHGDRLLVDSPDPLAAAHVSPPQWLDWRYS
jgi:hypothetical protein